MERTAVPELIHAIAHDVCEPVREIIGFAQLMAERAPEDATNEFWSDLSHIEAGAMRTRAMLNALCDYLAAADDAPTIEEIDLADLLDDVLTDTMAVRALHPTRVTGSFHGRVRTYPDVLRSVLVELITNAARFGSSPSDAVANIRLDLAIDDGVVRVSVTDDGPGVSLENAERAMHLFQRLDRSTAPDALGAGLAMARRDLERCGGSLTLGRSDTTDGLVATVALPIPVIDLRSTSAHDDVVVAGHSSEGTPRS